MKIALLLTGQLRTFDMCKFIALNSIIKKYDTDVFLSIDINNNLQCINKNSIQNTDLKDVIKAIQFFNPIDYFICYDYTEEYKNKYIEFSDRLIKKNIFNILKLILEQYYIVDKAYELLINHIDKTKTKYDLVIRLRFDQFIWTDNTFKILLSVKKNNGQILFTDENIQILDNETRNITIDLDVSNDNQINVFGCGLIHNYNYVNDQFFTHNHNMIYVMKNFYKTLPNLLNNCCDTFFPNKGCVIEHLFYLYLTNNNININKSIIHGVFVRMFN